MPDLRRFAVAAAAAVLLCGCKAFSLDKPRASVYEPNALPAYSSAISPDDGKDSGRSDAVPENTYAAEFFLDSCPEGTADAYRALYEGIFTCAEEIELPPESLRKDDADDLIALVNSASLCGDGIERDYKMYVGGDGWVEKISMKYLDSAEESAAKYRAVCETAEEIASHAQTLGSDYDKVKYFHDVLVGGCEYSSETPDAYRAYGALVGGRAVCEGYAKAFELLCGYVGIPCLPVGGSAKDADGNSQLHMWNKVQLDGEWYNVDCTWDDPVGGESFGARYDYFLLSDRDISANHTEDSGAFMTLPRADCETGGYFAREGKTISRTDDYERRFADEIKKYFGGEYVNSDGIISFKCEDTALYTQIRSDLFETDESGERGITPLLREYLSDSLSISYLLSCNDALNVINLKIITEEIYG